ncbi:hypothetical protein M2651_09355 [Clostridium sp. SYSU_GA19001]|uniref:hypothetical protein n=1 Tax=Clostridium caldaquaticum TaxID=2940653 RepID=UPI00207795C3|nr:hypothetical protein [Clostridium caldaquaticum]MCM8711235.1 hypothetical protein [Clostridium caldaquaticum]
MKNQSRHRRKTILTYFVLSVIAIVVNKVYAIFSHGVSSAAMTWMFLYPLIGGLFFYLLIYVFAGKILKFTGYRLFFNIYNSGIAILTFGSFVKGVLEIAGADSPYLVYYYAVGGIFIAAGLILMSIMAVKQKRVNM